MLARACLGGPSQQASLGALSRQRVSCLDRDGMPCVTTENLVSRQGVGQQEPSVSRPNFGVATRGLRRGMVWYRDMTFGVTTMSLQWKTKVCRDKVFSVSTGFGCLVLRRNFCVTRVALQCETGVCHDRVPFCRDRVGCMVVGPVSCHDLLCRDNGTSVGG